MVGSTSALLATALTASSHTFALQVTLHVPLSARSPPIARAAALVMQALTSKKVNKQTSKPTGPSFLSAETVKRTTEGSFIEKVKLANDSLLLGHDVGSRRGI